MLKPIQRASALLVALTLSATSLPVHAQPAGDGEVLASLPADRVELRNGGMVQGSILEILPNDSLTIVSEATGARKTFSWSEIVGYERGGERVEIGETAQTAQEPAATPPQTDPEPAALGPRLHIETTRPARVQLYEITSEMVAHGANVVVHGINYRPACTAPCDKVIDVSRGTPFFFGGDGLSTSTRFNLSDARGDVTATVKPGRRGLRTGGIIMMGVGSALAVVGGALIVFAKSDARTSSILDDMPAPPPKYGLPIGVIIGGVAILAGGIAMYVTGLTRYKLKGGGLGLLRPLRFG